MVGSCVILFCRDIICGYMVFWVMFLFLLVVWIVGRDRG